MKITVIFHGVLADFIGEKRTDFDLPEDTRYADLLAAIGRRFGRKMPDKLWDKGKNIFKAAVLATRDERHLTAIDVNDPLDDGDEIKFLLMSAGG